MSKERPANTHNTIFSYMSAGPHNPVWGYWREFTWLERIRRWAKGLPAREYVPGLVDKMSGDKNKWHEEAP